MKLEAAAKYLTEVDDEDRNRPPPVKGGGTISTAQAAKILGVVVSRVRQLIGSGKLKSIISPRKGDRDHELLKKDVDDLAVRMGKKSGKSQNKGKDKHKERKGSDSGKSRKGSDSGKSRKGKLKKEDIEAYFDFDEIVTEYLSEALLESEFVIDDETMAYFKDVVIEHLNEVIIEEDYDLDTLIAID